VDTLALEASCKRPSRPSAGARKTAADELTSHKENSLLRIADGADDYDDVEEAAVSRLQLLALVEQRGFSFGLTLMGVRKVAQLKHS
jgi:hypothetical protein